MANGLLNTGYGAAFGNQPMGVGPGMAAAPTTGGGGTDLTGILGGLTNIAHRFTANFAKDPTIRQQYQQQIAMDEQTAEAKKKEIFASTVEVMKQWIDLAKANPASLAPSTPARAEAEKSMAALSQAAVMNDADPALVTNFSSLFKAYADNPLPTGEAFTLGPGETRYDATGQPVASVPGEEKDTRTSLEKNVDFLRQRYPTMSEAQVLSIAASLPAPSTTQVSVPGEFGDTTMTTTSGGYNLSGLGGGGGAPAPSGGGQMTKQPVDGGAGSPEAPAGGRQARSGKPMSEDAQNAISGAFLTLDLVDELDRTLNVTGLVKGQLSKAGAFLGTNKEAIDFQTARDQLKVASQALIRGTPSTFDAKQMEITLPAIGAATEVNKARVETTRRIATALIKGKIAYFKFTGTMIPDEILDMARQRGIDVESVPAVEKGADPMIEAFKESFAAMDDAQLQAAAQNPKRNWGPDVLNALADELESRQ